MIRKILTYYAGRLDEYLGRTHRQPEGVATVGLIGTAAEETPNSVLSDTLEFIQSMPRFETEGHRYTVELVPMSTMDLHNIWTTMGGQYHPSVICKVRGLVIDSGTLVSGSTAAQGTQVGIPAGDAHGRQVRHGRPADRGIWRKTDRRRQHFPQACTAEKPSSAAGRRVP